MAESQDLLRLRGHRDPTGYEDAGLASSAGGSIVAPAWAVGAIGTTVALSGVLYFVWRARRARQKSRFSHPTVRRG
jgi:hypothetical protein